MVELEELTLILTAALYGAVLPATVTMVALCLAEYAGKGRGDSVRHLLQALALGTGLLTGFVALAVSGQLGWDFLKPADPWAWLPLLALLALAAGVVDRLPSLPVPARWTLRLAVAVSTTWLLVRAEAAVQPVHAAWAPGLTLTIVMLWGSLDLLARRWPGAGLPTLLALVAASAAVILVLAGILKYAQMTGVVAAVLAACACIDWWRPPMSSVRGAIPALSVLLPGLLFAAYFRMFSNVPLTSFLLIPAAPVAGALLSLPSFRTQLLLPPFTKGGVGGLKTGILPDLWPKLLATTTAVALLVLALLLAALA